MKRFIPASVILRCILRLVLGGGVYFGLSTLSKLPFFCCSHDLIVFHIQPPFFMI
ncbi:hypothetical protein [Ruminococcus sp.]|uniref:hypothetical protein n=1 Tax=Ruminococcus sp. TaxID=41978 RepID=UPI00388D5411